MDEEALFVRCLYVGIILTVGYQKHHATGRKQSLFLGCLGTQYQQMWTLKDKGYENLKVSQSGSAQKQLGWAWNLNMRHKNKHFRRDLQF